MIMQLIHEYPQQSSVAFWVALGTLVLCSLEVAEGVKSWLSKR